MPEFNISDLRFMFSEAAIEYGPNTTTHAANTFDAVVEFANNIAQTLPMDELAAECNKYILELARVEEDIIRYSASTGLEWDKRQLLIERWVPLCMEYFSNLLNSNPSNISTMTAELASAATQGRLCLQGVQSAPGNDELPDDIDNEQLEDEELN